MKDAIDRTLGLRVWTVALLLPALVLVAACSESTIPASMGSAPPKPKQSPPPVVSASTDQFASSPKHLANALTAEGGLCPIDYVNRQAVAKSVTASKRNPFGIEGWVVTAEHSRPTPPLVFVILRSQGGDYFLEGRRKPRPDVAKGDPLLQNAGFESAGYLANVPPGQFSLRVATGDEKSLVICDPGIAVKITD